MIKKLLLFTACTFLALSYSFAQESPKWLRKNSISPNGKYIAFSYKGDIYVVSSKGGRALQITSNPAYESNPLWSNDSKKVYYTSTRNGSMDIFCSSRYGGTPKRITDMPGNELPISVLPDGKIVFKSYISVDPNYKGWPGTWKLYTVGPNGGKIHLMTSLPIENLSMNDKGQILYEDYKGYENYFRKHEISSVTRDIWLYTPGPNTAKDVIDSTGTFKKLTTFAGEDRMPVFAKNGKTFYYLSEQDRKAFNVYESTLSEMPKNEELTHYTMNPVRYLSVSKNGKLAFSYNGDLYTLEPGDKPKKLNIMVYRDSDVKKLSKYNLSDGATSIDVSPNNKEIALVVRGDVYVTSIPYKYTKRITNTPEQERNVSFSKDGRSLYYSSERNGHWGIYKSSIVDPKAKLFSFCNKVKEEKVSKGEQTAFQPVVSPDGKWIAYLRNRTELVIQNVKTGKIKSLLKGKNYSYQDGDLSFKWSPDSRYLLSDYMADGGWNHNDIALINIKTGKIIDLTQSGYNDNNFRWALGGKAMTWESDKNGLRSHGSWGSTNDIYIMFFDKKAFDNFLKSNNDREIDNILQQETVQDTVSKKTVKDSLKMAKSHKDSLKKTAKDSVKTALKDSVKKDSIGNATKAKTKKAIKNDKKKELKKKVNKDTVPALKLDLVNRQDRIIRLTPSTNMTGDYYLNNDGQYLYYVRPNYDGETVLYRADIRTGDVTMVRGTVGIYPNIIPSKDGQTIYLLTRYGRILVLPASSAFVTKTINYSGNYDYMPFKERAYIFSHVWKQVLEKFYDPKIHGIDWKYYRDNYKQFLPYINNNYDFAELLSELLGELNGSHTGAMYRAPYSVYPSYIGIIEDPKYNGKGVKILEVLEDGPLNLANSKIKKGDIITAINNKPVNSYQNWRDSLANLAGKRVILNIKCGKKNVQTIVRPISSLSELLYKRWVKQREDIVRKLSDGKIGYVHVKGMDSPSFRNVYSKALGKYRNCEALIVDTRHNGGGWLHDDLATFLSGKEYIRYCPRGQFVSVDPYNKWVKPSCVLVSEDNYSDASGFPYIYQSLGIGKLIGAPVPGTMTAVWWENQVNPRIVFGIPQVGAIGVKNGHYEEGKYLEGHQINPDVLVYNDPKSRLAGRDKQLEVAVKTMLNTVEKQKASNNGK